MTEFEKYLQGFVETYYENASETDKETLLNRIVCDAGNKRYVVQEGRRRMADGDEKGDKIYDLSELRDFPDIDSEEFKSNCLDTNSPEHKACEAEIKDLVARFTGNDSNAAADLKALLAHSEIEYRVRKNWTVPNGSCAFQKGENGTPDKIVICISDLKRLKKEGVLSEINEDALPQILAHELGHAVEFGKRPKEWQTKYMDGAETAADLYASSLLFNCGISERGFSQYMGMDYDKKKEKGEDTRMPYTPDGGFRRDNFIKSEEVMKRAKINELRGLSPARRQPLCGNDARPATKHNRQCHRCQNTQPIVKASFVFLQRSFFTVATAASGCSGCGSDLPRATERQTPLPEQKARVDLSNIAGTAAGVISVTLVGRAVYLSSLTLSAPLPPREKVPRSTAFSDFCAGWRFVFNGDFSPPR